MECRFEEKQFAKAIGNVSNIAQKSFKFLNTQFVLDNNAHFSPDSYSPQSPLIGKDYMILHLEEGSQGNVKSKYVRDIQKTKKNY